MIHTLPKFLTLAFVTALSWLLFPAVSDATALPTLNSAGILAYTNVERYREGVPLLTTNTQLSAVALRKMQDLFARQYFAHEAPTGESVGDLAKDAGYAYIAVGENLALGDFTSNKGVVDAWMKSPGHRANILASKFTEIGIATGKGMHKGRNVWLVVQAFGLPRSVCPPVDSALKKKIDSLAQMLEILEMVARMREKSIQKDTNISPTLYREKIDSYNKVVGLYNSRVEESKRLVATYNKSVDRLNACIKQKTSS